MEKQRQIKILSIFAVVLAICAMSLGYAAFSSTLNISSSATVSPNSSDFKVSFVPSEDRGTVDSIDCDATNKANCTAARISGTSLTGVTASFTEPDELVYYQVDIYNNGKYDAYLNSIDFGTKTCIAGDNTTDSLVQAACNSIIRQVSVGEVLYDESAYVDSYIIPVGEKVTVSYIIMYDMNGTRADGPFDVEFGDVVFNFSTVPNSSVELISFTVEGVSYQAEPGMTWSEWTNSSYNTDGYIDKETMIAPAVQMCSKTRIDGVIPTDVIVAGDYSIRNAGICSGGAD